MKRSLLALLAVALSFSTATAFGSSECLWRIWAAGLLKWGLDPIALRVARRNLRYISPPLWPTTARGIQIAQQVQEEFSPPLEPFMIFFDKKNEEQFLDWWLVAYTAFASPFLSRREDEVIAVGVSGDNSCAFCQMAHHQMFQAALGCVPAHPERRESERWAETMAIRKVFEYINRMMTVFTYGPNMFMRPGWMSGINGQIVNLRVGPAARRAHEEDLALRTFGVDQWPLQEHDGLFDWADSRPLIKQAFSHWHTTMLSIGKRLPISEAAKIQIRNLGTATFTPVPSEEQAVVQFAEEIILRPQTWKPIDPHGRLRKRFHTDSDFLDFVGWCSYQATLKVKAL